MLVLDRTGSMAAAGKGSSNGIRKIDNLKSALLQGFLPSLNGQDDRVGMVVFPPDTAGSPACSAKDNDDNYGDYYDPTRNYLEVGLTGGYLNPDGTLNPSSPVIEDIDCMMPFSRTDYADSLLAAEREFDAHARPGVAKVIVMISDGAANQIDDPKCTTSTAEQWACGHPCEAGINNANTLKKSGTEIYAIVYSDLEGDEYCGSDGGLRRGRGPHQSADRIPGHGADREPWGLPRRSRSGEACGHPAPGLGRDLGRQHLAPGEVTWAG